MNVQNSFSSNPSFSLNTGLFQFFGTGSNPDNNEDFSGLWTQYPDGGWLSMFYVDWSGNLHGGNAMLFGSGSASLPYVRLQSGGSFSPALEIIDGSGGGLQLDGLGNVSVFGSGNTLSVQGSFSSDVSTISTDGSGNLTVAGSFNCSTEDFSVDSSANLVCGGTAFFCGEDIGFSNPNTLQLLASDTQALMKISVTAAGVITAVPA